ncbi:hypothetical protein PENSPDRAFT_548781, partial [Peniophora sp. CONT]
LRNEIISDFQAYMRADNWIYYPCAVCGQKKFKYELATLPFSSIPVECLVNNDIPDRLSPITYDFELYDRAFLCAGGMHSPFGTRGPLEVCDRCRKQLERQKMPLDAIANYQYYAYERLSPEVRAAFADSTDHEKQLISGCRASRITYVYKAHPKDEKSKHAPRKYTKGNVAVLPQETGKVAALIPPAPSEIDYSICVVFVGGAPPTWENIADFRPVMVSRKRVAMMSQFLAAENLVYKLDGIEFSQRNLDALCSRPDGFRGDLGITTAVEILHVDREDRAAAAATSGSLSRLPDEQTQSGMRPDDLLVDTVGFARENESAVGLDAATKFAAQWCRRRRPFLMVGSGQRLLPERDYRALTLLFPHLDPFALGGYYNPQRKKIQFISLKRQLRNLIMMYDGPFEHDRTFAFVSWNIVQKMENTQAALFSIKDHVYKDIADELLNSVDAVNQLCAKFAENHDARPTGTAERRILQLLNKMKVITRDMPGSSACKLRQRNEIRGLLKSHGCPSLFVTITPADVFHILPYILSGGQAAGFSSQTEFDLARRVARNPAAAAEFFDIVMKGFLEYIVRYKDGQRAGVFGTCEAYYVTVEAQGRGTLHGHMVLWLRGNPSPQELRDRVLSSSEPEFAGRLTRWLEATIKCELPGMTEAITRPASEVEQPAKESGCVDPRSAADVPIDSFMADEDGSQLFEENYMDQITELAVRCNWHRHTDTCFKHLKGTQPRDDAHCRMRMTGAVQAVTDIDAATGTVRLRRLHPWVNNYNELILFLTKCNMDIKHIPSGESAKALVYYITDYITKGQLPTHVGLEALCAAIRKTSDNLRYDDDPTKFRRSLLTRIMNGIMGKMELSHQQVMAFVVGGGDHYTSHTFRSLNWGMLDKHI